MTPGTVAATLVPVAGTDDGVLFNWIVAGTVKIVYDGIAGGLTGSGSAGALDLDLSGFDSITLEASGVRPEGPSDLSVS